MTRPFSDELISAYLDGELDADERVHVEQAMSADADLRRMHDELRALRCTLQSLPRCELKDDLVDRALRRTESLTQTDPGRRAGSQHSGPVVRRTQPVARRWRTMVGVAASLAAALILIALVIPGVLKTPRVASTDPAVEVDSKTAKVSDQALSEGMKSGSAPSMTRSESSALRLAGSVDDLDAIASDPKSETQSEELGRRPDHSASPQPSKLPSVAEMPRPEASSVPAVPLIVQQPDVSEAAGAMLGKGGGPEADQNLQGRQYGTFGLGSGFKSANAANDGPTLSKKAKSRAAFVDESLEKNRGRDIGRGQLAREQAEHFTSATIEKVMQRLKKDGRVVIQVGFSGQTAKEARKSAIEWFFEDQNSRLNAAGAEVLLGESERLLERDHLNSQRRQGVQQAPSSRSDHDLFIVEGSAEQVKATLVNLQQRSDAVFSVANSGSADSSRPPSSGQRHRGFGDRRGGVAGMGQGGGMAGGGMMDGPGGMMGSGAGMPAPVANAPESISRGDPTKRLGRPIRPRKPADMNYQYSKTDGKSNTTQSALPSQADLGQKLDRSVVRILLRLQPLAAGPDLPD